MARDPFKINFSLPKDFGTHVKSHSKRPIDKNMRELVWKKYMKNKPEGKCYCCRRRTIAYNDFDVGHNKARSKGGLDHISNLRPICRPCNRSMRTKTIEWYRKRFAPTTKVVKPLKKGRKTKRQKSPEDFWRI